MEEISRTKAVSNLLLWQSFQRKAAPLTEFAPLLGADELDWSVKEQWVSEHSDVNQALDQVDVAIAASQRILGLKDDWDAEGALGYQSATLRRATNLARSFCWLAIDKYLRQLSPPEIAPADRGTVDLLWRYQDRYLLINVPDAGASAYSFYGESDDGETISGTSRSIRQDLLVWLLAA